MSAGVARARARDISRYRIPDRPKRLTDVLCLWAGGVLVRLVVLVEVKSSQVISAHSLPPLLASGAHSIGCRIRGCLLFMYILDLT